MGKKRDGKRATYCKANSPKKKKERIADAGNHAQVEQKRRRDAAQKKKGTR